MQDIYVWVVKNTITEEVTLLSGKNVVLSSIELTWKKAVVKPEIKEINGQILVNTAEGDEVLVATLIRVENNVTHF